MASQLLHSLSFFRAQVGNSIHNIVTHVVVINLGGIQGEQSGQLAVIARCNDTLFVEMARVVESGNRPRLGFAGVSIKHH